MPAETGRYVAVVETGSNQEFIFSTNKLRQNVGASELIKRLAAEVASLARGDELVVATSGRVVGLFDSEAEASELISTLTRWAIDHAPGLDVCGVKQAIDSDGFKVALRTAERRLAKVRAERPGPKSRFLRLPVMEDCSTSHLPAERETRRQGEVVLESEVTRAKYGAGGEAFKEFRAEAAGKLAQAGVARADSRLPRDLNEIERRLQDDQAWVGIVHADGSGVGSIVEQVSDSPDELRRFSTGLGLAGDEAFFGALAKLARLPGKLDVLPLIRGGDDVTILLAGRLAIPFTVAFLTELERATNGLAPDGGRIHGRAGVALVKPHFPFHAAYELAHDLSDRARHPSASAFDVHLLADTSHPELEEIEQRRCSRDGLALWGGPYVVGEAADDETDPWVRVHRYAGLRDLVQALREEDDGERVISSSTAHDLREALFWPNESAKARVQVLKAAHPELRRLLPDGGKREEPWYQERGRDPGEDGRSFTPIVDAIDLVDFVRPEPV